MGFIQKKDDKEEVDGIQIIGRGEGPDDIETSTVELVAGESAEDIAAGTTAEEAAAEAEAQMVADAHDEALMEGIDELSATAEQPEGESAADTDGEKEEPEEAEVAAEEPEKKEKDVAKEEKGAEKEPAKKEDQAAKSKKPLFIALAVALVVIGGVGGYLVGNGGFGASKGAGTATLTEGQLDTVVASWTYKGKTHTLTAKEGIEASYSLEKAKDDDGNYPAPSAETITSYIRNQILLDEAADRDITVSDDEMESFAQTQIGTSDYATMAENYGVTEEQAKRVVKENAICNKLYQQIMPDVDATMPDQPTKPDDDKTDEATKEYAEYIIKLAGDEWDSEKGTWASEDGDYYAALKDEKFTAKAATYAQAQKAYYVAYQAYMTAQSKAQSTWTEFANGLYAKASVSIYGLYQ